ncbi:MAG: phosphatidylglycerol lysyltransferase domain-containing protein [Clostridia bacterium]
MEFVDIAIDDKDIFDKYLKIYNPQESELTFTNLFIWRHFYNIKYAVINDLLCVISIPSSDKPFAFFPIGDASKNDIEPAVLEIKKFFENKGWKPQLKRVPEEKLQYVRKIVADETFIAYDMNNSDYVYRSNDLISLRGKKYDGKRNHINNFKKLYDYEYKTIDESLLDECKRIMDRWCAEHSCEDHKEFYCEKLANIELLNNYERLGVKGTIIMVDGVYEAFAAGEMLNTDTAVIHIEKANSKINGLYTYINQAFAQKEWADAEFINREQDLGVEGLRKSKLSYNPAKFVKKYIISLC